MIAKLKGLLTILYAEAPASAAPASAAPASAAPASAALRDAGGEVRQLGYAMYRQVHGEQSGSWDMLCTGRCMASGWDLSALYGSNILF